MKIGIDFGTTYTKIAFFKEGKLHLFRFPGPTGRDYIPTAVTYRRRRDGQEVISIGEAAISDAMRFKDVQFASRFKILLPIREPGEEHGWDLEKTPEEVTKDYFERLLLIDKNSFKQMEGQIESIVVSVPEVWQRTANNPGAEALRRILVEEMGLPVDHLRSEPVCAAAYYVYENRERHLDQPYNLLVCDMGGGTFDVALCRVTGSKIEVVDFDGNSQPGWGLAGARFDHDLVLKVYRSSHEKDPQAEVLFDLIHEFERVKIIQSQEQVREEIEGLAKISEPVIDDTPLEIYTFEEYTPTWAHVRESFTPIAQGISEVLARIKQRAEERGVSIDRVAIVGGFGQFPLVQRAILESLPGDVRFDQTLHREFRQFFAIAYGAALIANGVIQPVEFYPHTLGIHVFLRRQGRLIETLLPIVEAGKVPAGQLRPHWARGEDGKPIPILVERQIKGVLPVALQLHGTGQSYGLGLPPTEYPPPGRYHVGLIVDMSNMGILVFKPVEGKGEYREYRLGNVNPVLIAEE